MYCIPLEHCHLVAARQCDCLLLDVLRVHPLAVYLLLTVNNLWGDNAVDLQVVGFGAVATQDLFYFFRTTIDTCPAPGPPFHYAAVVASPDAGRESVAPTPRGVGPSLVPVGSGETTGTEVGGCVGGWAFASVPRGYADRGGQTNGTRLAPLPRRVFNGRSEVELNPLILLATI